MKIKQGDAKATLVARRERDRARRQAKRTAEVWAMPADEAPTEVKGKTSAWIRRMHPEHVQYFYCQYCE